LHTLGVGILLIPPVKSCWVSFILRVCYFNPCCS